MGIWNELWEIFFPRCCLVCGRRLAGGEEHLCFHCLTELPRTRMHQEIDNELAKRFWGKMPLERAGAYLFYVKGNSVRTLLYELKYYGNARLGGFLGRCMAADWLSSGFFQGVDCIVPVPLHPRKEKIRGYNQSELLAQGISQVTGLPVFGYLLLRERYTQTQTRKGEYERWTNVSGAFECADAGALKGKHVLLVDDVLTTGATLVACADALGQVPGLRISILTLAVAGEV